MSQYDVAINGHISKPLMEGLILLTEETLGCKIQFFKLQGVKSKQPQTLGVVFCNLPKTLITNLTLKTYNWGSKQTKVPNYICAQGSSTS